jgi:hypothetical protein
MYSLLIPLSAFCVGAHWLYKRPEEDTVDDEKFMPPKHWLWLTLCDDRTSYPRPRIL